MKEIFFCDHCDKKFEYLSELNRHIQKNLFSSVKETLQGHLEL